MKVLSIFLVSAFSLFGCATPDAVRMEGDTYLIQKRSAQIGFGPPEGAKADVYKAANEFCEEKGLVVETVDFDMVNSGFGRPGSVALQFRCVPSSESSETDSEMSDEILNSIEARLKKLDQLFDRGIISEEEYTIKRDEILDSI